MDKIKIKKAMLENIINAKTKDEINLWCKNIVKNYMGIYEYATLESAKQDYLELAEYCLDISAKRASLLGGDIH